MTMTREKLQQLEAAMNSLTEAMEEIDMVSSTAYLDSSVPDAILLDTIYTKLADHKDDLEEFIRSKRTDLDLSLPPEPMNLTMEQFIAKVRQDRIDQHHGMTLGKLHEALDSYDPDAPIVFSNGKFLFGEFDSYRGYYEDIGFDFETTDLGYNTVGKFKALIEKAFSNGIMEGYKGGEYPITEGTLVWMANSGTTHNSERIVDVIGVNGSVLIVTNADDY